MKEKVSEFWVNLVKTQMRFRNPLLVILSIITIVFCIKIYQVLTIKTDFFELYPQKHPYIQLYKEFRKMFGSANVLSIILERTDGQDIYNPETLSKTQQQILHLHAQVLGHVRLLKQQVLLLVGIGRYVV